MKKHFWLFPLLICPIILMAQVNFETFTSFEDLKNKALKEKKNIFVQIESEKCQQCNDVAMLGLNSTQLREKYNVNFVSTKISKNDTLYKSLMKSRLLPIQMGSAYFDSEGHLLFSDGKTTSSPQVYIEWADKALANTKKISELTNLEQAYNQGNRDPIFLEKYIKHLQSLGRNTTPIIDEYIGKLPLDSLHSTRIIRFVFEQGLPMPTRAFNVIKNINSKTKLDSIWNTIPQETQLKTLNETLHSAIRQRNRTWLNPMNEFVHRMYAPNQQRGDFEANVLTLQLYKGIGDTLFFIRSANFAARSLINISFDSLKMIDTRVREEAFEQPTPIKRFMIMSGRYATELNNMAWDFYEVAKTNDQLENALTWSKRSMEIHRELVQKGKDNAGYLDTYAHLLYKLKRYDEAVDWQQKAVDAEKENGTNPQKFEIELDKIKNRRF